MSRVSEMAAIPGRVLRRVGRALRWTVGALLRLGWWSLVAVVVVACLAGLSLAAAGRWWQPTPARAADVSHRGPAGGSPAPPTADTSAAAQVLTALAAVGDGAAGMVPDGPSRSWQRSALAPRCAALAPYLSWSRTLRGPAGPAVVGAEVYGAGMGGRALEARRGALSRCGVRPRRAPSDVAAAVAGGAGSVYARVGNTTEVVWRRGDVVVTVVAFGPAVPVAALATAVDQTLSGALDGRCADPAAPEAAARRNPSQKDYSGLSAPREVTGPTDVPAPSRNDLVAPAVVVPVPVPGTVTAPPVEPVRPELPATTATVQVRVPDTDGPGCGWSFVGAAAPREDDSALAAAAEEVSAKARERLGDGWKKWAEQATAYRAARAAYDAARAEYTAWAATTTTTSTTTTTTTTTVPTTTTTARPTTTTTVRPPTTTTSTTTTTAPRT